MKHCALILLFLVFGLFVNAADNYIIDTSKSPHAKLRPVAFDDVQWTEGFWAERAKQLDDVTIRELWHLLADPEAGHVLQNFKIAAGRATGDYAGTNWQDEWLYKWIEAAACIWRKTKDPWLEIRMNEGIALIAAAQADDGYLSTKIQAGKLKRFSKPEDHELYNMGHLLTAAVIHHRMTGSDAFLKIAIKTGDYLCETVCVTVPGYYAHNPSMVMGLVELYRTTGEQRYLDSAQRLVDDRGSKRELPKERNPARIAGSDVIQDRVPLRKANEAVGQNVFSTYLYTGAGDVQAEIGDSALGEALNRLWTNLTTQKMYIHGGISAVPRGVSHGSIVYEAVGAAHELPNSTGYNETCGQIGCFMWSHRLLLNQPDSRLADIMEREMYNGFLGGIGLDGKSWFYRNILRRYDKNYKPNGVTDMVLRGQPGRRHICCPSNLLRTIAQMPSYFYSVDDDDGIWIHHYGGTQATLRMPNGERMILEQQTNYPWSGHVRFIIREAPARPIKIYFRNPAWAKGANVTLRVENGKETSDNKHGYLVLTRIWKEGDHIDLSMPMNPQIICADPRVESARNQAAVMRGPVLYCVESTDLPDDAEIADLYLSEKTLFETKQGINKSTYPLAAKAVVLGCEGFVRKGPDFEKNLYQPINHASMKPVRMELIPYFAWANRGKSAMSVWMPLMIGPSKSEAEGSALLDALDSPIIMKGNAKVAYRDALLFHNDGTFHLYYSYVREEEDGLIYWYVATSESKNLKDWSNPRILTPKDQNLNYSSPGNIVKVGDEWLMCLQTYPIANFRRGDKLRFTDNRARLFIMRSKDLATWGEPELIPVKGPDVSREALGKMIDPFLLRDKDKPGRWYCFYKQDGMVRTAMSDDLRVWGPVNLDIADGENPCVLVDNDEYVLFYSPVNGIGVKRSRDLRHWSEDAPLITLGQKDWPWAETRLTAGYVEDLRKVPGVGKYVMVCHSMGPGKKKTDANVNANCNIVIAWSDDLKTWHWPGK